MQRRDYLQRAATQGGLTAAEPYLRTAAMRSPAEMAEEYMNPYVRSAVQSMSDIAQRNIRQNLSPMATAAAVGSGQFGSQRGAQVLGQVQAQAQQDLNAQIAQMLSSGYGQALQAAGQQQALTGQLGATAGGLGQQQAALLGQLGQTAGGLTAQQAQNLISAANVAGGLTQQQANLLGQLGGTAGSLTAQQAQNLINAGLGLGGQQTAANQIAAGLAGTAAQAQQAQNAANLQAAQTAAQAASQQAAAQQAAGLGLGQLAQQGSGVNLANINALATLGQQQQTIAQNQQLFPLTTLSNLAGLLQGYQIPTEVTTQLNMSPLSALAGSASMLGGLFTPTQVGGTAANPVFATPISQFGSAIGSGMDWLLGRFGASGAAPTGGSSTYNPYTGTGDEFSDIRLKKNIVKLGTRPDGLNVYEFDYIWGGPRQIGLMAHEVQDVYPDAVTERNGYLMVNYSKV